MNLGMTELLLGLGIVLLLFGPSKLTGLGKSLGEAIRGFKKGINETDEKAATQIPHDSQKDAMSSSVKEKEKQS